MNIEFDLHNIFFTGLMYCWGWVVDRCAKSSDAPRQYKTKDEQQGQAEALWQQEMAGVVNSHYRSFCHFLPQLDSEQRAFLSENGIKYTMPGVPAFSNMAVTFDFFCAKHFDHDHTWALGCWYNQESMTRAQEKQGGIPLNAGGHFVVPSCGVAFDMSTACTLLVWNGSRHLHSTAILKTYNSLRIGTSMQVTSKHFKHEVGERFFFIPSMP